VIVSYVERMRSRNNIRNELVAMKKELEHLKSKETQIQGIMTSKERANQTSSHLLTLLKYMMDESRTTRMLIEQMYKKMERFEQELNTDLPEEPAQGENWLEQATTTTPKLVPISELDRKIVQHIGRLDMACADDIRKLMGYKGKNAASARLNKLLNLGVLTRYQVGHKVYYRYDAGKTTKSTLIVSPPQIS
jgi:hypothetical protein